MDHNKLILEMTKYYSGDPQRIQHFMKVYAYARMIGEMEGISGEDQEVLEVAAIVHDIGIKVSMEKYGDSVGKHQEAEGPDVAREMLESLGYDEYLIQRVCYLVGHHHTYHDIDGIDYQILVEADFLVNLFEDKLSEHAIESALKEIFVTAAGIRICKLMFGV
ncbi:HD domain-containing protein [Bariatricus sp. SGI.154]|uniref:HD domain-containing protein n=1 Tax=Bariatricus sp. SGI.154 TaxID=3420549 RepID=UPI003D088199